MVVVCSIFRNDYKLIINIYDDGAVGWVVQLGGLYEYWVADTIGWVVRMDGWRSWMGGAVVGCMV